MPSGRRGQPPPRRPDRVALVCADDTIAEVDPSGIVTGLRGGSTTLTLQSADGKISASCPVQVSSPLRGIALDDYTLYFDDELVTWITADGTRESDYAYASRVGAVCHLLPEDTTDHPAVTITSPTSALPASTAPGSSP